MQKPVQECDTGMPYRKAVQKTMNDGCIKEMEMNADGIKRIQTRNDQYQVLHSLKTNRKKRAEHGEIFVEGIEAVKQVISSGWAIRSILSADFSRLSSWGADLVENHPGARRLQLAQELYRELSDKDEPAEMMLTVEMRGQNLKTAPLPASPLILVFDRPSDMGNLGSLVRSANALGVDLIILNGHGVDPYDPKTIRASLGAVFHTPIVQNESADVLESWLNNLRSTCRLQVVGTDSGGDCTLSESGIRRPLALILGNEAKGMSVRLKQFADRIISIPLTGEVNSLNVACAGSICLWQACENSRRTL